MIVYNIGGAYDGCYYVRQYLPQLLNGWDGDKILMDITRTPEQSAKLALMADIVVFHRPDSKEKLDLAQLLKAAGKKIVMDNDDTYLKAGGSLTNFETSYLKKMNKNLYDFAEKYADLITLSTQMLKREYEQFNKEIHVLENCVYPIHIPDNKENTTGKLRIGLVGSAIIYNDWKHIEKLLYELNEDPTIQLVVFGLRKPQDRKDNPSTSKVFKKELEMLDKLNNIEWHSSTPISDYFNTLSSLALDIMIIPREDTYFNYCKSNLKFLESSMMHIPCIVQGFINGNGPYDNLPDNTCIKCYGEEQFRSAINTLRSKKERTQLANMAYKYVLQNYNIEKNYIKWYNLYKKLITK